MRMLVHGERHPRLRPVAAQTDRTAQHLRQEGGKIVSIARTECQHIRATQFARTTPVRGQQRNVARMHLKSGLRKVVLPQGRHHTQIRLRKQVIKISRTVAVVPVQPRQVPAQGKQPRHHSRWAARRI